MPEIDVVKVFQWPHESGEPYFTVENPVGDDLWDETQDMSVHDLVAIGAEFGVARWSEATDEDRQNESKRSYRGDKLVLIGWAEAVIGRDEVKTNYHRGGGDEPMVNIKVYDTDVPTGAAFEEAIGDVSLEDDRLTGLSTDELRDLVVAYLEGDEEGRWFWAACEAQLDVAKEDAKNFFFDKYPVDLWTEGRSGGWLVVDGLPNVEVWGPELLAKWKEFTDFCDELVKGVPAMMVTLVLLNAEDELAGRVHTVSLRLVLGNEDLEHFDSWSWRKLLGLHEDSKLAVSVDGAPRKEE